MLQFALKPVTTDQIEAFVAGISAKHDILAVKIGTYKDVQFPLLVQITYDDRPPTQPKRHFVKVISCASPAQLEEQLNMFAQATADVDSVAVIPHTVSDADLKIGQMVRRAKQPLDLPLTAVVLYLEKR